MIDAERVHCSTGRLTAAQAGVVEQWRARLLEDRPPPGVERVGPMLRAAGRDDRPRASSSDLIAVAVGALMARAPTALALAAYDDVARRAQRQAAQRGAAAPGAPVRQPVSFYLAPALAQECDELRAEAQRAVGEMWGELRESAREQWPADARERARWTAEQAQRLRLPERAYVVPMGAVARMAIDRWAGRNVDRVTAAAVAYAEAVHEQPHRGRRDMGALSR